jgi:hypothetical protein
MVFINVLSGLSKSKKMPENNPTYFAILSLFSITSQKMYINKKSGTINKFKTPLKSIVDCNIIKR